MADYITADDGNGNVETFLVADYIASNPGALVKTPTDNFAFNYNGTLTSFVAGQMVVVTADQFAAMTAAGLPIA